MKTHEIYMEYYLDTKTYTVYIHLDEVASELVRPLDLTEDMSLEEANSKIKDMIDKYNVSHESLIYKYMYDREYLQSVDYMSVEEFLKK